eukprot:TRINITY_DN26527_c0_g6_i1.p1 TRINITY_DN26527_c0_g6~~TRINITY_DN26527_c0_g6_i1.p1  ORF type:complete len:360 (-),score=68.78 TRINITY_DN26527_c0_g6_i1:237-1316(-)
MMRFVALGCCLILVCFEAHKAWGRRSSFTSARSTLERQKRCCCKKGNCKRAGWHKLEHQRGRETFCCKLSVGLIQQCEWGYKPAEKYGFHSEDCPAEFNPTPLVEPVAQPRPRPEPQPRPKKPPQPRPSEYATAAQLRQQRQLAAVLQRCEALACGLPGQNEWMCKDQELGAQCSACPDCRRLRELHPAAATFQCAERIREWERETNMKVLPAKDDSSCFYHSLARHLGQACDEHGACDGVQDLRNLIAEQLDETVPELLSAAAEAEGWPADARAAFVEDYIEGTKTNRWAGDIEMTAAGRLFGYRVKYALLDVPASGGGAETYQSSLDEEEAERTGRKESLWFVRCNYHWMPAKRESR